MLHDNQNGEVSVLGDLEPNQSEMDIQKNRLKQKVIYNPFGTQKSLNLGKYKPLNAFSSMI